GATGPLGVAGSLAHAAASQPALLVETALLAAVAFALPYVFEKGLRWSVGLGAAMLGATILALPAGASFSVALSLAACSTAVAAFSALWRGSIIHRQSLEDAGE